MEEDGGVSKRECFIRFDEVNYWLSRTRDLITNAETYRGGRLRCLRQIRQRGVSMSEKRNEHCPAPQQWVTPDKIVTLNANGRLQIYTEVSKKDGSVKTTTYVKTTP
jgi:hypothetical protein